MIHWRRYLSELMGTAALLCAVIGSGIMAEHLSGGNQAIALLANTLATVFALYVLIETLGPIGGAHFNPVVLDPPCYAPRFGPTSFVGLHRCPNGGSRTGSVDCARDV